MRLTDWKRGNPYTFHMEDLEMLMSSGYIFARKFDENVDNTIIESIYRRLIEKGEKNLRKHQLLLQMNKVTNLVKQY